MAKLTRRYRALTQNNNRSSSTATAKALGGEKVDLSNIEDPRVPLMKWLRDPSHAMLSRAFVNRVWASYFNVGIVNPPDDLALEQREHGVTLVTDLGRKRKPPGPVVEVRLHLGLTVQVAGPRQLRLEGVRSGDLARR